MKLIHFSSERLIFDWDYEYEKINSPMVSTTFKPQGFWFSVESENYSWLDFCRNEDFRVESFKHGAHIKLDLDSILVIKNRVDFLRFFKEYSTDGDMWSSGIKWEEVAKSFKGIIIAPYLYEFRLSHMFYYGWDCASGCVWDLSAVKSVTNYVSKGRRNKSRWVRWKKKISKLV